MKSILIEALATVEQRADNYGGPRENFANIAAKWSVTLGITVTPAQVGLCMIDLKTCRHITSPQRDNLVDVAGYAHCVAVIEQAGDDG